MEKTFNGLPFKEQEFVGGFFRVFGREERMLVDIVEDFMIEENAAIKAKDKAFEKLADLCKEGKLGDWRTIYKTVQKRKCRFSHF